MNEKIRKLREQMKSNNLQGMIVSNPINIKYLTNIDAEGVLLLTPKENIYITDGRYMEDVNSSLTIEDEIIVNDIRSIDNDDYENFFMFCENVGFEEDYVSYARYKKYQEMYKCNNLVETEGMIEKLRVIKSIDELDFVKKACEITDYCYYHLLEFIKAGKTEIEIAAEIERYFIEKGADGVAFASIVASGPNSSKPHAVPTHRKVEENDIVLIDMGCKYKGYCSDMSRTIFVGSIPDEMKKIYNYVLKNQQLVLREVREGRAVRDLARYSENDFSLNKFTLIHALGHGVGLEVHESPILSTRSGHILKENTVLAVEPGIYIAGSFGVRIEDTILVTKDGCIPLTKAGKNYTII